MVKKTKGKKLVQVHSCFDMDSGETLPNMCACNQKTPLRIAQTMVDEGEAKWIPKSDRTQICLLDGMKRRTPRTATIDAKHMERAYVLGDLEEQKRIDYYGQLSENVIANLVVIVPYKDFDRQSIDARGRPVMWFVEDNRTRGGIGGETQ